MAKARSTFDEALDDLISEFREDGEWIDEIISSMEVALMGLKQERDN